MPVLDTSSTTEVPLCVVCDSPKYRRKDRGRITWYCRKCHSKRESIRRVENIEVERERRNFWRLENAEQINKRNRERYAKNPAIWKSNARKYREKNPHKKREYSVKKYGLTLEAYEFLLKSQNGRCAICLSLPGERVKNKALCVDHDHKTNKVRGLLCGPCNHALGLLGDTVDRVEKALAYIRRSL